MWYCNLTLSVAVVMCCIIRTDGCRWETSSSPSTKSHWSISSTHTEELQLLNWYNFTAGIMREIWKSTTKQLTRCLDSMYTSSTRIVGFVWLPATQCKLFRVALLWFLSEFKDLSRCLSQPSHAGKSVLHFSLSFTLTATFLESLLCVMFLCYW